MVAKLLRRHEFLRDTGVERISEPSVDLRQEALGRPSLREEQYFMRALADSRGGYPSLERSRHRFRDGHHLIPVHERVEADREMRARREATANAKREADVLAPAIAVRPMSLISG